MLVVALRGLGFALTEGQAGEVVRDKDFIQLKSGPFNLNLVFAPHGIESFAEAWSRRIEVERFPVCHPDDIIRSKGRPTAPRIGNHCLGSKLFVIIGARSGMRAVSPADWTVRAFDEQTGRAF